MDFQILHKNWEMEQEQHRKTLPQKRPKRKKIHITEGKIFHKKWHWGWPKELWWRTGEGQMYRTLKESGSSGEMAQRWRPYRRPGSIPRTYTDSVSSRGSKALCWLRWAQDSHAVHKHACRQNIHTYTIKKCRNVAINMTSGREKKCMTDVCYCSFKFTVIGAWLSVGAPHGSNVQRGQKTPLDSLELELELEEAVSCLM